MASYASLPDRGQTSAAHEWPSVFGDAKMTTALLDRFTHPPHANQAGYRNRLSWGGRRIET